MRAWPNRGPPAAPAGGWKRENPRTPATNLTIRPTGSDSSQPASAKPGVVQNPVRFILSERHGAVLWGSRATDYGEGLT